MPGPVLETRWHASLLALSCALSLLGTFTTVLLLDERRRSKHRTRQRLLMIGVAIALGGVAVWCARQVASSALLLRQGSLELTPYHDLRGMVASLLLAVMSVLCGLALAANDKYFGATKQQRILMLSRDLKLMIKTKGGAAGMDRTAGMKLVEMKALTADLWIIAIGGFFSAMGVISADYVGLSTTYYVGAEGAHAVFRVGGITATVALGFVSILLAYWMIFRVLQWRQREEGLRLASALIISVPICSMHYLALTSVDYHHGPIALPPSYFLVDSHGVWQLVGVMCCVAYCTLGLYITTYNVRTEMSALKDEIDTLSRAFASMNTHNSGTASSTNAYQNKLDAFLYKCAAFLQRYTRNTQDLAFDGVAQRLKVIRKHVPTLQSPHQLAGRLSRVLTAQWNNRVAASSDGPGSPQSSYGQSTGPRSARDTSIRAPRGSTPAYSPAQSPTASYEIVKDPVAPQPFAEDAGAVMAVISEGTESDRVISKSSSDPEIGDAPILVPPEAPPGVDTEIVRDPYADAFEMAAPRDGDDNFMYTDALARKPSADLPPVNYKAPMPERMYGSYASWGEGMRGESQGPNHAKHRSSGGESVSVSVSERRRSSSSISMPSSLGLYEPSPGPSSPEKGAQEPSGDDREGSPPPVFLPNAHFPFPGPTTLSMIPECEEAAQSYNNALDSTKSAADVLLEATGRASTLNQTQLAAAAGGEGGVEGETVVRLQRLSDGALRLVAVTAVNGREVAEVVRVETDEDAQATARMLADALLAAMQSTTLPQGPPRLTLRRMPSDEAGPQDGPGHDVPPKDVEDLDAKALGRQSDVDMQSVIESHLDQWEEQQIFSAMLSSLLPSRHTPPHTPTVDNPLSPRSAEAKGLTTRLLKHTETEDLLSEPRAHSTSGSGGLRRSVSSTVESSGRDRPKPAGPRKQASMGAMGALLRQWSLTGQRHRSRGISSDTHSSQGCSDSPQRVRQSSVSSTGSMAMRGLRALTGQPAPTSEAHSEADAQAIV